MVRSVVTSIAAIPDAIQRSVYLQTSASQLGLPEDVLGAEVAKTLHAAAMAEQKRSAQQALRGSQPQGLPPHYDSGMPPPEAMAEQVEVDPRTVVEDDLIRALLEYATDTVSVTLEADTDGEAAEVLEVPFAELVIHRLEEEGIQMRQPMNQTLVQRFSAELDHERILTPEQLTQDQDHDVQQKVAGAMIQQHVLSPNWSERHKIYPVVEKDQLMDLLESALRRLHLWDLKKASAEVSAQLQGADLPVDTERDLLAQKVEIDAQIRQTLAHFGTVILP